MYFLNEPANSGGVRGERQWGKPINSSDMNQFEENKEWALLAMHFQTNQDNSSSHVLQRGLMKSFLADSRRLDEYKGSNFDAL